MIGKWLRKDQRVELRLTVLDRVLIQRAAGARGMSVSDFLRNAAVSSANKALSVTRAEIGNGPDAGSHELPS